MKQTRFYALPFLLIASLPFSSANAQGMPTEKLLAPAAAPAASSASVVRFRINGYRIEGANFLSQPNLQTTVAPFTGEGKTLQDIFAAADAVKEHYVREGYPVTRVITQEQLSADGYITLRVIEGRISKVTLAGNKHHDDQNIRAGLPQVIEGEMPNAKKIVAALALINENPSKQVALNLQSGKTPGAVDAKIDVQDETPLHFTVGADNTGGKSTGEYRVFAGFEHANLFNRDHVLTAQVATSDRPSRSASGSVGYRLPIYPWGISVEMVAAYSDSDSGTTQTPNGALAFTGKGTVLGLKINQPLVSVGAYRHKLIYGLDYKNYDNRCITSGTEQSASYCGTITSIPASLTYAAQYADPGYQISGALGYYRNIPGGAHGSRGDYEHDDQGNPTYRAANWQALRGNIALAVPLAQWTLRSSLYGQGSKNHLISAEQFGLGGAGSIRGYSERAQAGDTGVSANVELYTPDFGKVLAQGLNLKALVFYDAGRMRVNKAVETSTTPASYFLASYGVGLRADLSNQLSLRLDAGVALKNLDSTSEGVSRKKNDVAVHFGLNYRF